MDFKSPFVLFRIQKSSLVLKFDTDESESNFDVLCSGLFGRRFRGQRDCQAGIRDGRASGGGLKHLSLADVACSWVNG
jgi:hypothetical protein